MASKIVQVVDVARTVIPQAATEDRPLTAYPDNETYKINIENDAGGPAQSLGWFSFTPRTTAVLKKIRLLSSSSLATSQPIAYQVVLYSGIGTGGSQLSGPVGANPANYTALPAYTKQSIYFPFTGITLTANTDYTIELLLTFVDNKTSRIYGSNNVRDYSKVSGFDGDFIPYLEYTVAFNRSKLEAFDELTIKNQLDSSSIEIIRDNDQTDSYQLTWPTTQASRFGSVMVNDMDGEMRWDYPSGLHTNTAISKSGVRLSSTDGASLDYANQPILKSVATEGSETNLFWQPAAATISGYQSFSTKGALQLTATPTQVVYKIRLAVQNPDNNGLPVPIKVYKSPVPFPGYPEILGLDANGNSLGSVAEQKYLIATFDLYLYKPYVLISGSNYYVDFNLPEPLLLERDSIYVVQFDFTSRAGQVSLGNEAGIGYGDFASVLPYLQFYYHTVNFDTNIKNNLSITSLASGYKTIISTGDNMVADTVWKYPAVEAAANGRILQDDGNGATYWSDFSAPLTLAAGVLRSDGLGATTWDNDVATIASSQTLTNKNLSDTTTHIIAVGDATKRIGFLLAGSTTGATLTLATSQTTSQTLSIPNVGSGESLVSTAATQSLTNKSLVDTSTALVASGDATKRLRFNIAGSTTGAELTLSTAQSTTQTLSIPNVGVGESLVSTGATQTLTNKTLTLPTIASISNGGTITIPSGADTFATLGATQTLTNKTLGAATTVLGASSGQLIYQGATTLTGNNNLFWDITNSRLGIGTNTPSTRLSVLGNSLVQTTDTSAFAVNNGSAINHFKVDTSTATVRTLNNILDNGSGQMLPTSIAFTTTDSKLSTPVISRFVIPTGVSSITAKLWGGGGGMDGGSGGYATLTVATTPGDVFYVLVGGGGEGLGNNTGGSVITVGGNTGSANDFTKGGNGAHFNAFTRFSNGGGGQASALVRYSGGLYTILAIAGGGGAGGENGPGGGAGVDAPQISGNSDSRYYGKAGSGGVGGVGGGSRISGNINLPNGGNFITPSVSLVGMDGNGSSYTLIGPVGNTQVSGGGGGYGGGSSGLDAGAGGGGNYNAPNGGGISGSSSTLGNTNSAWSTVSFTAPPNDTDSDYIAAGGNFGRGGGGFSAGQFGSRPGTSGLVVINIGWNYALSLNNGSLEYKASGTTLFGISGYDVYTANNILDDGFGNMYSSALGLKNSNYSTRLIAGTLSANNTLTLPTGSDTLVGRATADTLTNKTLTAPVISSIVSGGSTLTLPSGTTDTLVALATTDTLSNKTITSNTNTVRANIIGGTVADQVTLSGAATTGQFLKASSSSAASWATFAASDIPNDSITVSKIFSGTNGYATANIASTLVYRDASGNFAAGLGTFGSISSGDITANVASTMLLPGTLKFQNGTTAWRDSSNVLRMIVNSGGIAVYVDATSNVPAVISARNAAGTSMTKIGYNNTDDNGYIQASTDTLVVKPLKINPSGGAVTTFANTLDDGTGLAIFKSTTNSSTTFQVQNAAANPIFTVSTLNGGGVTINTPTDNNAALVIRNSSNGAIFRAETSTNSINISGAYIISTMVEHTWRSNSEFNTRITDSSSNVLFQADGLFKRTFVKSSANSSTAFRVLNSADAAILTVSASGTTPGVTIQTPTNNNSAFRVQNLAQSTLFNIDTDNGITTALSLAISNTTNQLVLGTTNTTTLNAPAPASSITLTLPNTADTIVGRATTDTLTNKTLGPTSFTNTRFLVGANAVSTGSNTITIGGGTTGSNAATTAAVNNAIAIGSFDGTSINGASVSAAGGIAIGTGAKTVAAGGVAIGLSAGTTQTAGSNNIFIGGSADDPTSTTAGNAIVLAAGSNYSDYQCIGNRQFLRRPIALTNNTATTIMTFTVPQSAILSALAHITVLNSNAGNRQMVSESVKFGAMNDGGVVSITATPLAADSYTLVSAGTLTVSYAMTSSGTNPATVNFRITANSSLANTLTVRSYVVLLGDSTATISATP